MITGEVMRKKIEEKCFEITKMLLEKNKSYGNSIATPINVFSNLDPIQQVELRIDDKLKRIRSNSEGTDHQFKHEDSVKDLIGYLILYEILKDIKIDNTVKAETK
jgi:hypothetical protein